MRCPRLDRLFGAAVAVLLSVVAVAPADAPRLRVLFLGDDGPHRPAERFRQLAPVLAKRGIDLTYTDRTADLNPATLAKYDALAVFANTTKITPAQEKALLDYVAGGKGFVPLHCASYCFLNSPAYIALVGAQFRSHGTGVFRTVVAAPDHPIMKGYAPFASWDETYVHTKHNEKDRTVLEYRADGDLKEPWTWVRTQGKGRVFYTAWGHDARTWGHPGFQNLVERGIRWACGGDPTTAGVYVDAPEMTPLPKGLPPFKYTEAEVPFYPSGGGRTGDRISQMQLPVDPAESMRHLATPTDFEVKLFATEKLIGGKPICMNWDERGRLWVAVTRDYPNERQPAGRGRDRIVVLEDTDGDGMADKVTVFADKLSIPTSITFANGGVIVHQAPQTLFLKDSDGDGVADVRQVLFEGWSTDDTHAGPSNLRYGLDNWLYSMVGYAGFVGEVGGERLNFRTGFFRFKPDGSRLEFLRNTNNNSWGVGFSEEGILFGSTANGCPSVYLPIPNRYYEAVRGWSSTVLTNIADGYRFYPITDKVRQVDHHGGFTSAAGHALYTARAYPPYYWNRTAFVSDPTGHLSATFVLQKEGADFRSRNSWNLLASDDEWCAPIMAEVGPDGNVWLIDWYAYIVQHNPTPRGFTTGKGNAYETPLRDVKHGRIYRLVPRKAPATKPFSLAGASPERLVETLTNDNMFWRLHAQRLLVERGNKDVVPALRKLVQNPAVDAIGLNPGAIHALWTLHGLGALADADTLAVATAALRHPSAGVRRNAALVQPAKTGARAILDAAALTDADAQVRLSAYLSLADKPTDGKVGQAVAQALDRTDDMTDRWLPDAVTAAAAAHAEGFLLAVAARTEPLTGRAVEVVNLVAAHHAAGAPTKTINALLVATAKAHPSVAETILGGLARGWKGGAAVTLQPETEQAFATLLPKLPAAGKASLLRLGTALGSKAVEKFAVEVVGALQARLADESAAEADRVLAAKQIVELMPADDKVLEPMLELIAPRSGPGLVAGVLDAVGASRSTSVSKLLLDRMPGWTPGARTAALRILLAQPASTLALLDAVEAGKVKLGELALDQKQALAAHPNRKVAARAKKLLAKGGDLPSPDRQKVVDRLLPLTQKKGDPAKGKLVFKNQCSKCHMHSGEGTAIGPDLTGMAAHPKDELLVHIMDPSRSVEGNFRVYTVQTGDGKVVTGMLASETRTSVEIIDAEAKKITLQRDNIEQLTASSKSLMPEGFEKQLKEDELVDLLEFLTQRGKYLPLPLNKVATIVSTRGMFHGPEPEVERLIFADWKPKTFNGVPFHLVDPQGERVPNVVMLYGTNGMFPPKMPKAVSLPCNSPARAIHLLSGVSGWGYPALPRGSVSLIVRLHYKDGKTEDHRLINGEHFADYIRRVDVPGSRFAFPLRGQQIRYLAVTPKRDETISSIELVKGKDASSPVIMAVTVETK
ncbi:MAG: PVC-type heme-binding CxxCH protein [Gemmataceae bacterium]